MTRLSMYNNPSVNLATGVAYVDRRTNRRGSSGRCRHTTCADRLRAQAKGKGATLHVAYGGWPIHNPA